VKLNDVRRGLQGLAAFLKAIGFLIPLMDAEYASYYTREVMLILIREFASPDEEMKKIVLKVSVCWCIVFMVFTANNSGGEAVLRYRWCRSALHPRGNLASLFQKFLEPPHGTRSTQLSTGLLLVFFF
jgi:hypothetical protein